MLSLFLLKFLERIPWKLFKCDPRLIFVHIIVKSEIRNVSGLFMNNIVLLSQSSYNNHIYYTKWVTIVRIIADLAT